MADATARSLQYEYKAVSLMKDFLQRFEPRGCRIGQKLSSSARCSLLVQLEQVIIRNKRRATVITCISIYREL